jgi:hypothetical protein
MTRWILLTVVPLALLACKKPACRGQLSQEDLRALRAKGEAACSELTRAAVKVDDEGLVLDGLRINIILPPAKKIGVPPLDALLGANRDNWKAIHEGQSFDGTVDLEVPSEMDVAPGVSVAAAVAQVGYHRLNVHTGDLTTTLDWWVNAPSGSGRVDLVHVESDPKTRGFVVRLDGQASPRRGHRYDVADREAATRAIGREWSELPGPPPSALILRVANGTFHDALALVQAFRAAPELATARVAIEIGSPSR